MDDLGANSRFLKNNSGMSLRILHVVRSLRPETGGPVTVVRGLTAALEAAGHGSHILSLDQADAVRSDVAVHALDAPSHGYGYTETYVSWLRAHRHEFDAVVIHGLWQYQSFGAWRALAGIDTPYLVYCHGMLDPWFKRTHRLKHLRKCLYWPLAEYRALRDARAVCFTCDEERRLAPQSFRPYRVRAEVAPIGVAAPSGDAEKLKAAFHEVHPQLHDKKFILFLGRIHSKKGIEELIAAHAQVARLRPETPALVIAGPCADPAYQKTLRSLAPPELVHWLPMLEGDLKWGALHACAAFALLSHQENFGLAVVEALACGRPVLLSKQVNIWAEIIADQAGLADEDTIPGGVALLTHWLKLTPEEQAAMGRAALRCFQERFEINRAAATLTTIITRIIARP